MMQSPPQLLRGAAPPFPISRRILEMLNPSSAALRQAGQHPQMLLSSRALQVPSHDRASKKRKRNTELGRDEERGCCFLLFLALLSTKHKQGCMHQVPPRPYAEPGTDVTKPHHSWSPRACKTASLPGIWLRSPAQRAC